MTARHRLDRHHLDVLDQPPRQTTSHTALELGIGTFTRRPTRLSEGIGWQRRRLPLRCLCSGSSLPLVCGVVLTGLFWRRLYRQRFGFRDRVPVPLLHG